MKNLTLLIALLSVTNLACRLPKYVPPKTIDENFVSMKIEKIGMLPTADLRQDATKPFKHSEYLRKWLRNNIRIRGYASEFTGDEKLTSVVTNSSEILKYDKNLEKFFGDSNYRFVFLPILNEKSSQSLGVGKTASVSIMGVIYDKEQKKVIWMNEAGGEDTGFMAMSALSNVLAVDDAIGKLMSGLPKRKK